MPVLESLLGNENVGKTRKQHFSDMGTHRAPPTAPGAPASGPAGVAIPAETRRIGNRRSAVAIKVDGSGRMRPDAPISLAWCRT